MRQTPQAFDGSPQTVLSDGPPWCSSTGAGFFCEPGFRRLPERLNPTKLVGQGENATYRIFMISKAAAAVTTITAATMAAM